jgi:hypothetical protein
MDVSALLVSFLPMLSIGAGYLLRKEVDRKYISALEEDKHRLQKKIEDDKVRQQIRFKAELIAELLAVWISYPEDLTKLNQLSFQAFLWLPDDIALDLSNLLAKTNDAKSVPVIIAEVRKHLLGPTDINGEHIITFSKQIQEVIRPTVHTFNTTISEIVPKKGESFEQP